MDLRIRPQNVVASASLRRVIPLSSLGEKEVSATGLLYRVKSPKAAVVVLRSGEIVSTGTASVKEAREAILKVVKRLEAAGISRPRKLEIRVEEIIASARIKGPLSLGELAFSLKAEHYQDFGATVVRLGGLTFLLLADGKIIASGKDLPSIEKGFSQLRARLESVGIRAVPA